jgi:leucyl aminopeptidase (aminopeptidase T)
MNKVWTPSLLGFVMALASLPVLMADETLQKQDYADPGVLANKLVTQCARVKDGDIVQIAGGIRDVELLENLAVEAAKQGADTLLTLSPSDQTVRRLYTDVPAKFDSRLSPLGLKLVETITVIISVDASDSDSFLADVPPERIHARSDAATKMAQIALKRNVRQIYLGNGLYPTGARARQYGLTREDLAKLFYDGLNVNYDKMMLTGEATRRALDGAKNVHIATPEGTDLTVDVAMRPCFVSDGVISDDKLKKGGPACQTWLPAGEVYVTPVPGTATGRVFVESMLSDGKEIRGLSLTFKNGKMTDMKAKSGLERIQAMFAAGNAGKDEFSAIDIGINHAVRMPNSSPAGVYMEAGTITVLVGNNVWAGGENKSTFGFACFLRGGTLDIDGRTLVQNGVLHSMK